MKKLIENAPLVAVIAVVLFLMASCTNNEKSEYSNSWEKEIKDAEKINFAKPELGKKVLQVGRITKVEVFWVVGSFSEPELKKDTLDTINPHDVGPGKRLEKVAYLSIDTDYDGTPDFTKGYYWGHQKVGDDIMLPCGHLILRRVQKTRVKSI